MMHGKDDRGAHRVVPAGLIEGKPGAAPEAHAHAMPHGAMPISERRSLRSASRHQTGPWREQDEGVVTPRDTPDGVLGFAPEPAN